jgi:hypothetical protein
LDYLVLYAIILGKVALLATSIIGYLRLVQLASLALILILTQVEGERNTRPNGTLLPRPHQNSAHYGPQHHTLALHRAKQAVILLRDCFYFILARSRIVPTLSAPSTASLG